LDSTWSLYDLHSNRELQQLRVQFADTCALFEVSRDSLTPASSLRVCLDDKERHLLVITTEVKHESNQIIDSKLEFDSRAQQKTLKYSLNWNTNLVSNVLKQIIEQNYNFNQQLFEPIIDSEIYKEIQSKFQSIYSLIFNEFIEPLISVFSDEFNDLIQELSQHFPPLVSLIETFNYNYNQLIQSFNDYLNSIYDVIQHYIRSITPRVISDALQQWSRVWTRALRQTCIRNSNTCYQYVYAYERYGFEGIIQLSVQKVYESARQTHRFAFTTIGYLKKTFIDLRNTRFLPNFDYVLDTRVTQWFNDYIQSIIQSLNDLFERILDSNQDLRQLLNAFNRIITELSKQFESIDWSRVRESVNDVIRAVLTPESSSTRVLLWDPHNGRIMVEMRAPVIRRQLRAIMTKDNVDIGQSWSSLNWFKDMKDSFFAMKDKKKSTNKNL
jgi:hypothetical protein